MDPLGDGEKSACVSSASATFVRASTRSDKSARSGLDEPDDAITNVNAPLLPYVPLPRWFDLYLCVSSRRGMTPDGAHAYIDTSPKSHHRSRVAPATFENECN